jgi:hypothetical protein
MISASVAVGSDVAVDSAVGVACGAQPRTAKINNIEIAVSAKKRDRGFGMKSV